MPNNETEEHDKQRSRTYMFVMWNVSWTAGLLCGIERQ